MTTRSFISMVFCAVLIATLGACASLDRHITKFEPIRTEAEGQVFKFTAFADIAYPLLSEDAEKTRIEWLETWLSDNGYNPKKYEIISRVPVLRSKGLFGPGIYDVFYEVRATK
jgi:hypothetical protein